MFWGWVANALYHSFVSSPSLSPPPFSSPSLRSLSSVLQLNYQICYWFVALTFRYQQPYHNGLTMDLFSIGNVSFTCVVIVVTIKLALETRYVPLSSPPLLSSLSLSSLLPPFLLSLLLPLTDRLCVGIGHG